MGAGASLAKDSLSDASDAQIRSALGELSSAEWTKVHEAAANGAGDAAHWVCRNFSILHNSMRSFKDVIYNSFIQLEE